MDFEKMLREAETTDSVKLYATCQIDEFEDKDIRQFLNVFYGSKDPVVKRMATIFNSAFFQRRGTFIFAKSIANILLKADENSVIKSCDTSNYKELLRRMCSKGYIKALRPPSGRRAGIYKIVDPDLRSLMIRRLGVELLDAQEKVAVDLYDNYSNSMDFKALEEKTYGRGRKR